MVVFDVFFVLTVGSDPHEAVLWLQDPNNEPEARPGAADLVQTYQELGYEILYVHSAPNDILIGGEVPITEALRGWLERHGLPVDEGVHFWDWEPNWVTDDPDVTPLQAMIDELVDLTLNDVDLSFGYSAVEGRVNAFISGGIPRDRLFTLGEAVGVEGTTSVPGDDLEAHAAVVRATADEPCETE